MFCALRKFQVPLTMYIYHRSLILMFIVANCLMSAGRIVIGLYGQVVPKTVGMSAITISSLNCSETEIKKTPLETDLL